MPFNLFKKPSTSTRPVKDALNSDIFPSPEITYGLTASILRDLHPDALRYLTPADTQQFLTDLYGSEPSLHWTWIGISFPPKTVRTQLEQESLFDPMPRAQRNALYDFCKQQQSEEEERKGRYFEKQGSDAGNAYVDGEKKRKAGEVVTLRGILGRRRERLPVVVRDTFRGGETVVWYEREGDDGDGRKKKGRKF
ncbi:MAG: hypothetical protein Q9186_003401 [Xanthomendoza sp. 1 TL-2023]